MNEEINSILESDTDRDSMTEPAESLSRRDFNKKLLIGGMLAGSAAMEMAPILASDPAFMTHASTAAEDAARVLTSEPRYLNPLEYTNYYAEHQDQMAFDEAAWVDVIAPGLDKFFNLYFAKPLEEGLPALSQIGNELGVDPQNLQLAAAYWGSEKIRTEGRVVLEKATNLAQAYIGGKLDTNLPDTVLGAIDPNLKPVQSLYESKELEPLVPSHLRTLGAKRLRTVGPNDSDSKTYSAAIVITTAKENLPTDYYGSRIYNGARDIYSLSKKLDSERINENISNRTARDFVQASRVMERQITQNERDLEFGLKLFSASIRYREYLMQKTLGLNNLSELTENQRDIARLMLISMLDSYPNIERKFEYDPKLDGQFSYPEDIATSFLRDIQKLQSEGHENLMDANLWPMGFEGPIEYLKRLK